MCKLRDTYYNLDQIRKVVLLSERDNIREGRTVRVVETGNIHHDYTPAEAADLLAVLDACCKETMWVKQLMAQEPTPRRRTPLRIDVTA